jgi:hypothetical protein
METLMTLRRILLIDAATCALTGLVLSLFAPTLEPLLGLPYALLQYAGLALLPIAAFMAWVALRAKPPVLGVWTVIAGNAAWVLASLLLVVWLSPSLLGYAFVIAQAVVVALLAELEYAGLRKLAA